MRSFRPLRSPPTSAGGLADGPRSLQGDAAEPIVAELFSVERLEQHAQSLAAAQAITSEPRRGHADPAARRRQRPRPARVVPRARRARSRRSGRSRRPPSGWSTTSTSSTSSCARSVTTCLRTTTASCRSSPRVISKAIRGSSGSRGRTSRTRTAASTRKACAHGARVPGGRAADDRRALGDRDQPADPAGREPPAPGRADRAAAARHASGPTSSPTACSASATTARKPPLRPCAGCRARGCRRPVESSSSSDCATRTRP